MKIGVDLRALQIGHQFRGIGMVVSNYVEELSRQVSDYDKVIFYIYEERENPIKDLNMEEGFSYELRMINAPKDNDNPYHKLIRNYFRAIKGRFQRNPVSNLDDIDVFLQFDVGLGIPKSHKVTSFVFSYDLIPIVMPNEYLPSPVTLTLQHGWKQGVRAYVANSVYRRGLKGYRRANHIFAISKQTKESLIQFLGIAEAKISVVYLALPKLPESDEAKINTRIKSQVSSKTPYLLFVGGIDPRRKVDELVAAYNNVRADGNNIALVIAGKEFGKPDKIPNETVANAIHTSSYPKGIKLFGFISNEEKSYLYKHALVFVYPTRYEGFGLPILEGMASRCPVITYKNSSIPEVGGDAVLYADDFEDVACQINMLLSQPEKRAALVEMGVKQADKFSWRKTVAETLETINKLT